MACQSGQPRHPGAVFEDSAIDFGKSFDKFAHRRAGADKADITDQYIPKLRKLVQTTSSKPMAIPCDAGLLFAARDTAIGHFGVHASEFIKREGLIRGFHPFAPEENGPPLPQQKPSRQHSDTRRKQNDQRERQHEIEDTFLKTHHTPPKPKDIPSFAQRCFGRFKPISLFQLRQSNRF